MWCNIRERKPLLHQAYQFPDYATYKIKSRWNTADIINAKHKLVNTGNISITLHWHKLWLTVTAATSCTATLVYIRTADWFGRGFRLWCSHFTAWRKSQRGWLVSNWPLQGISPLGSGEWAGRPSTMQHSVWTSCWQSMAQLSVSARSEEQRIHRPALVLHRKLMQLALH